MKRSLFGIVSAATLTLAFASGTASAQCNYVIIPASGQIDPGIDDVGNHLDDGTTAITLPFEWSFYGTPYTSAMVSSNGNLQFVGANAGFTNACLPTAGFTGPTMCPHWDDLRTDGAGGGIFTSTTGTAPNRVFNIEWRAVYFAAATTALGFEIRLFEGSSRFEFVYGTVPNTGVSATIGIQNNGTTALQHSCNTASLAGVQVLRFDCDTQPFPPSIAGIATEGVAGSPVLFSGTVTPGGNPASTGLTASVDLSGLGGSATQALYNDGTNGDATAGDSVFSFLYTLPAATPAGPIAVNIGVRDTQGRTGTGGIALTVDDAGNLPASSGDITDGTQITGTLTTNDADMWSIFICDPANFGATTVGGATFDTQLFLFDANGVGVVFNDDSTGLQSTLTSTYVASVTPGQYYLAISQYDKDPLDSGAAQLWLDQPFAVERQPDDVGAANPVTQWSVGAGVGGPYTIMMTGVSASGCFPACVADFDDGSGTGTRDGGVTLDDLLYYLVLYGDGSVAADIDNGTMTGTRDGVTLDDLLYYLFHYELGC
jgi:hypothetical protein